MFSIPSHRQKSVSYLELLSSHAVAQESTASESFGSPGVRTLADDDYGLLEGSLLAESWRDDAGAPMTNAVFVEDSTWVTSCRPSYNFPVGFFTNSVSACPQSFFLREGSPVRVVCRWDTFPSDHNHVALQFLATVDGAAQVVNVWTWVGQDPARWALLKLNAGVELSSVEDFPAVVGQPADQFLDGWRREECEIDD